MPPTIVRALATQHEVPQLTMRQRVLVKFAERLTRSPQEFTYRDAVAVTEVLADEDELVEAATVVAGFNFANRVADALDVQLEVPAIFKHSTLLHRWAVYVMSWGIRVRMNFSNRTLNAPPPDEVLADLARATRQAGMGSPPSYFERLRPRPHILAGQAAICKSLLSDPGFSRETLLRVGYLISSLNHDEECAQMFSDLLQGASIPLPPINDMLEGLPVIRGLPPLEWEILRFARAITLCASEITSDQILSLRGHGLDDRQILNLVLISASYNAGNRLNRCFTSKDRAPHNRLPDKGHLIRMQVH